ncbi:uncharacterized protein LOC144138324 isoform X2 [Haemaphysalis longicornis]
MQEVELTDAVKREKRQLAATCYIMDRQPSDAGPSSSGKQHKARKRSSDKESDSPSCSLRSHSWHDKVDRKRCVQLRSLGTDKSTCSPKRHKSRGPDAKGESAAARRSVQEESDEAASRAVSFPEESGEALGQEPSTYLSKMKSDIEEFVGATLDYLLPCTAAKGNSCQIVDHLPAWNEFFCLASWKLQETPGTSGELSLMVFHEPMIRRCSQQQMRGVTLLVCWLLQTHRCMTEVELGNFLSKPHHELLSAALRRSPFVTSVKLRCYDWVIDEDLVSATLSLQHLQVLECSGDTKRTATLVEKLPAFLQTTTSLTVLRLTLVRTEGLSSETFFRALERNISLKDLVLPSGVIAEAPPYAQEAFTQCVKNNTSLTSLTVAEDWGPGIRLECVLKGLPENLSIVTMNLACSRIYLIDIYRMSTVFRQNRVLRSFKITTEAELYVTDEERRYVRAVRYYCLKALIENHTLEEVTLPIAVWDENQWKKLFKALPKKEHLKRVTIKVSSSEPCPLLEKLCVAIRGTDAEKKVSFDSPFIAKLFDQRRMCGAFSGVKVVASDCREAEVCRLLECMPSLGHITWLHLKLDSEYDMYGAPTSAFINFLGGTRTLRTITLTTRKGCLLYECQNALLNGLAVNSSIREFRLEVETTEDDWSILGAEPLADAINDSKNISRVYLGYIRPCDGEHAFFEALSRRITDNYTLLDVTVPESADRKLERCYLQVWETTWRNKNLLTRAADFARGARRNRQCALALKQVHGHPELVETVARLENIHEEVAAARVQDALKSLKGMHEFMMLAQVVREWVVCEKREDGRTQLDALNDDCWSVVTRYLKLEDIRDPAEAAALAE